MSEELKPCPFCGGEPEMTHAVLKEYYSVNPEVICRKCGYSIKARDLAININYSPEENCAFMDNQTIPIWNTRPEEDRLKAENERLKEILKIVKGGLVYKRYLAQLEEDAQTYQWSKGLIELINAPDKNIGTKTETNGEEQVRWE